MSLSKKDLNKIMGVLTPEEQAIDDAVAKKMQDTQADYLQARDELESLRLEYLKSIFEAKEFGYTQADTARVLGITKQRVYQLLKDHDSALMKMYRQVGYYPDPFEKPKEDPSTST